MNFDDYQKQALVTAKSTGNELQDLAHWVLGVTGEAGEIAEKVKKIIRDQDGYVADEAKTELAKEIGDVLWYLAVLADHLGVNFNDIAESNIAKLRDRQARGVIKGSGDNR
jgi:NTP pyrophosphatase (non-canonical NTP hydrolase)